MPDGYLSPSTCAALYGAAIPFWALAMRRVRRRLLTRFVPLLSLVSAFSFVVMMFNVPLPGGTTGHAVGVGIATVVLGPSASILAISVALLIQALFFGDGGVTTLGANCFNMAIVGSLVAYATYRLLAGRSPLQSSRRVVAAALAGYAAINAAAVCTAVELGLQPLLFVDGTGAPLYAPYPLHVALPVMLVGHLTLAGLAELIVAGGVVAYLQRSAPSLLAATAPGARGGTAAAPTGGWRLTRPLWAWLAALMVATPLGLLAAGAAWGEWSAGDLADPATRAQIAAASQGAAPPAAVPHGLARLSRLWSAPLGGYAPPFMHSAGFGYLLSAVFGVGLVLLAILLLHWLAERLTSSAARRGLRCV